MTVTDARRAPSPPVATTRAPRRPGWRSLYAQSAILADILTGGVAFMAAAVVRFGMSDTELAADAASISYRAVVALLVPAWIALLGLSGAYDARYVGSGSEEFRRVLNAAVRFVALVASVAFFLKLELARGLIAMAVPFALAATLATRSGLRRWMTRRRASGRYTEGLVVVGSVDSVVALVRHFRRAPDAGFTAVGAVVEGPQLALDVDGDPVPVLGSPGQLLDVVDHADVDAVAIADTATLAPGALRTLTWHLEGTGVDLLVAPALTDIAGPRIAVRPIAGLPLLHVEEPDLEGVRRLVKAGFDRTIASVSIVVLAPLFVAVALVIRVTSPGPAYFRQVRVGRHGTTFRIWKYRTMHLDAETAKGDLVDLNEHDGVLFKIRQDPRRTPVGRVLRRFSIDELPQLFNVAAGHMSLVGPRPPIPGEVEHYADDVRRRLLVKPGLTGLWQVNGRADLSWEESVRLDLYYVENWSPALDVLIMFKTVAAVLTGRGAY